MQQKNILTSYDTAIQNSQDVLYNAWITDEKGRTVYKFQNKPNSRDIICNLDWRDQCNIFRLRTGHVMLNGHRNRVDPLVRPMCRHCEYLTTPMKLSNTACYIVRNSLIPERDSP